MTSVALVKAAAPRQAIMNTALPLAISSPVSFSSSARMAATRAPTRTTSPLATNQAPLPARFEVSASSPAHHPNWRAARSFMISSAPPPIIVTFASR